MKKCNQCGLEKKDKDFYEKRDRKYSLCKICFNKYCQARWQQRKVEAIKYKGGKCSQCSYSKNYGALDFHHRDKDAKDSDWTKLRLKSWDKIIVELDKCDLLCKNCHSEYHYPHLNNPII
jgi:hypothetical protein